MFKINNIYLIIKSELRIYEINKNTNYPPLNLNYALSTMNSMRADH